MRGGCGYKARGPGGVQVAPGVAGKAASWGEAVGVDWADEVGAVSVMRRVGCVGVQ